MLIPCYYKYIIRTAIMSFWFLCLLFFLFLPRITSWLVDKQVLNILIWTGTVDTAYLRDFEKKTGVKINIMYFDNNEELFVKLYASGGRGYDLIMPSDYSVAKLIKYELIQPLEKEKFSFLDRLDERLMDRYFDPGNKFTLPYHWGIIGIGINKKFFNETLPRTWKLLFETPYVKQGIGMVNVAREALLITALHLFNNTEHLNEQQLTRIQQTLIEQKKYVQAYIDADVRSNYLLLSQAAPIVIASTPYIQKIMPTHEYIEFMLPTAGSFMVIDNLAIPKATEKKELIYSLIEYLYTPEMLKTQFLQQSFFPATKELEAWMQEAHIPLAIQKVHTEKTIPLYFFKDIIPEEMINKIWLSVKTA